MAIPTNARRRFWLPRFSLRLLLLAFTAFAVGFPVWYRWPYEEETFSIVSSNPFYAGKYTARTVTTWQRQWGGGRKTHGAESWHFQGALSRVTNYRDNRQHGAFIHFNAKGRVIEQGQHVNDDRDGIWTRFYDSGRIQEQGRYVNGNREGPWVTFDEEGRETSRITWKHDRYDNLLELSRGESTLRLGYSGRHRQSLRKIVIDGQIVEDRLARLLKEKTIDSPAIRRAFEFGSEIEFVETPLADAADFLADRHEIPVFLDLRRVDPDQPLTSELRGLAVSTTLTILCGTHGLACDYRYGCICITSAEDVDQWRDPTGVAEIQPPAGSPLAAVWNEPVNASTQWRSSSPLNLSDFEQPLAEVLAGIAKPLGIAVDATRVEPTLDNPVGYPVKMNRKAHPFRHVIGLLLYSTGCHCELEGEWLVISPPDSAPNAHR